MADVTSPRIFIDGLPASLAERGRLLELVSPFGAARDVWVRRVDCTANANESWAFVTFSEPVAVDLATAPSAEWPAQSIRAEPAALPVSSPLEDADVSRLLRELGNASFEAVRRELSRAKGRPMLRADAEVIAGVLRRRRQEEDEGVSSEAAVEGVTLVSAYSSNYAPGPLCEAANREYASRHGYGFECDVLSPDDMHDAIAPRRALNWYKVLAIRRALADAAAKGGGSQLVVWLDADAFVTDRGRRIEAVVETDGGGRDLVLGEDVSSACLVNTGVIIIRASPWSLELWRQIWEGNLSRRYHNKLYHEQSALSRLLVERGELETANLPKERNTRTLSRHVCVLPHGLLQTSSSRDFAVDRVPKPLVFHAVCRRQSKVAALQHMLRASGIHAADLQGADVAPTMDDANAEETGSGC